MDASKRRVMAAVLHVTLLGTASNALSQELTLIHEFVGTPDTHFGRAVAHVGDVDADTVPDIAIGASGENAVYVYSGSDHSLIRRYDGEDRFGQSVASPGDVDGDLHSDLFIDAPDRSVLISGLTGEEIRFWEANSAHLVGDVDGDGLLDVGTKTSVHTTIYSSADGTRIHQWNGYDSTKDAGDINGDGHDDLLLFNRSEDHELDIYSGLTGLRLTTLTYESPIVDFGAAGDVDGDRFEDIFVAFEITNRNNSIEVLSGRDGERLQVLTSESDFSSDAIKGGLDVDGDGIPNLLLRQYYGNYAVLSIRSGMQEFLVETDNEVNGESFDLVPDLTNDNLAEVIVRFDDNRVRLYAGATPPLRISPPLPGFAAQDNTVLVSNGIPNETVYLAYASREGTFDVPGCPGIFGSLDQPVLFGSGDADESGEIQFAASIPGRAAKQRVLFQAVQASTCRMSDVREHFFLVPGDQIIYVDDDAPGGHGYDWDNALSSLEDAEFMINTFGGVSEIWIADGTYGSVEILGDVDIYGGFVGGETRRSDRRPLQNRTIIGSLEVGAPGADLVIDGVWASGITLSDGVGFTLRNSDISSFRCGVACLLENVSIHGGSTVYLGSGSRVRNCRFEDMRGDGWAGAVGVSDATFQDCVFNNNEVFGGWLDEGHGGAVRISGQARFFNCHFTRNRTTRNNPKDRAGRGAAAAIMDDGEAIFVNCLFVGNRDEASTGTHRVIHLERGTRAMLLNTIYWDNGVRGIDDAVIVRFSVVQGGFHGPGNLYKYPKFVDPSNDDFRLQPDSNCIDAGANLRRFAVPFDFDGLPRYVDDPNTPDTGFGEAPIVDIGPHEFRGK